MSSAQERLAEKRLEQIEQAEKHNEQRQREVEAHQREADKRERESLRGLGGKD